MIGQGQHILIVGAGLAGSLLACYLADLGYRVTVAERRPDPRRKGFVGGRSINLALSVRGIHALRGVGLDREVLDDAIAMPGRMIHSPAGELTFQPYSKNESDAINSVSRGGLNITLLDAAEKRDGVTLKFEQRCIDVDLDGPAAVFHDEESGEELRIAADAIIGADGAFSAVRERMQKTDRFSYSQEFLTHGYKELSIPPTEAGEFAMDPHALHIWPRGGAMMIALPNKDRSFTCTIFWPFEGEHSFAEVPDGDAALHFFGRHYPDALPLMPTLREDFENNPTSSLVTIRCHPWHHDGKVLLIGDAAHAIVPFYGQGMNAAFEDCVLFVDSLNRCGGDLSAAFRKFSAERKDDADAVADLALQNFIEMRDLVGSKAFLWRKRLEKFLHRALPGWYKPLYNMVSFSTVPYAEARRIAERQNRIIGIAAGALVFFFAVALFWILDSIF